MTKKEKQELNRMLRDLRTALEVPPPKGAGELAQLGHYAYLIGQTRVVLDSALVTLSA
jgi:hypothetical protein